jgi:PLP dependent protein
MEAGITAERAARVRERIEAAASRAGRAGAEVGIVAVTKGHGAAAVFAAHGSGLHRIGENRVQELESKRAETAGLELEWHLIGHLQRNKVRRALPLFDLVHSLDNERLARVLSEEAVRAGVQVRALVQVNASGEASKGGFAAVAAAEAIGALCELPGLRIEGLMTMAPFTDDESVVRRVFAATRAVFDACRGVSGFEARHLSMGMSGDFEIAVEEGSTLVRLGTIIFGEREP